MTPDQLKLGAVFGALKITAMDNKRITVECRCGWSRTFYRSDIIRNHRTTCGRPECPAYREYHPAAQRDAVQSEHIGKRFGALVITGIEKARWSGSKNQNAFVQCDCGKQRKFLLRDVLAGDKRSCGCGKLTIPWDWKLALYTKWGNAEAA